MSIVYDNSENKYDDRVLWPNIYLLLSDHVIFVQCPACCTLLMSMESCELAVNWSVCMPLIHNDRLDCEISQAKITNCFLIIVDHNSDHSSHLISSHLIITHFHDSDSGD